MSEAGMTPRDLTLGCAVTRANTLAEAYSKERVRLEEGFTKLLLPAVISIAALLTKQVFDNDLFYYAVFLTSFFGCYTFLIAYDLYASERVLEDARHVQDILYQAAPKGTTALIREALSAEDYSKYEKLDAAVGKSRYIMPTGKLLISGFVAVIILVVALIRN